MVTRELNTRPRILPLYARAVAPLLPGASRLPWVAGAGGEIPHLELTVPRVLPEPARVAEYGRVCAFPPAQELPATYPHVLAFPMHLALMADGRFPFAAVGLVHLANCIEQLRPIQMHEQIGLRVRATALQEHPRGQTFSIVTECRVAGELVWRERSTMLHRARRSETSASSGERPAAGAEGEHPAAAGVDREHPAATGTDTEEPLLAQATEQWQLPGDLGRRYAAVSGDRNPIHLHPLSARALGFQRAIAHGMWTKARCLAALQAMGSEALAGAFSIDARFRRPILLPAKVDFAAVDEGEEIRFEVRGAADGTHHLDGRLRPMQSITQEQEESQ